MVRQVKQKEAAKLAEPIPGGMSFELVDRAALEAAVRGKYLVLKAKGAPVVCVIGEVANLRELSRGSDRLGFDCKTPDQTAYRGIVTNRYTVFTQLC